MHVRRPFINALGCDPTWTSRRGVTTCKEKFNAVFFHMYNWKQSCDNKKYPGPQGNEECGFFTYKQGSTKILGGPNLDGLTGSCLGSSGPWGAINWIAGRPYKANDIHNNGRNIYPDIYGAYLFLFTHI